ncbi:MAG: WbqC-like protein family [Rhodobacteraceae bacterium HLUCCA12]|nr:MAG: WbqC-like protein family [Rhodobacteraceae bacterium HLUCCA12]
MRCMISQPTFLPWLGWFDLADQADLVILLDTVQFDKRSWQQRNRIRTPKGLEYVTVPVASAGRFEQRIMDVELADPAFGKRLLRTLRANYARAPHFAPVMAELETVLPGLIATGRLAALNEGLIRLLAGWLSIDTPMRRASEIGADGRRGAHLAQLCKAVGATTYLSTAGAEAYLREDAAEFSDRGISVQLHDYTHPEYSQLHAPFLPHASALDLVMMQGRDAGAVMRAARRTLRPLETGDTA